jgi:hypothetical protein
MTLPVSVLRRIPKEKAVSPGSRGLMGQGLEEVLLIRAGTSLASISLTVAAVTVIVVASVYVTGEAIEAARRRRKRREKCLDMFVKCQDMGPPCTHIIQGSETLCGICRDKCDSKKIYPGACYSCGFSDPN